LVIVEILDYNLSLRRSRRARRDLRRGLGGRRRSAGRPQVLSSCRSTRVPTGAAAPSGHPSLASLSPCWCSCLSDVMRHVCSTRFHSYWWWSLQATAAIGDVGERRGNERGRGRGRGRGGEQDGGTGKRGGRGSHHTKPKSTSRWGVPKQDGKFVDLASEAFLFFDAFSGQKEMESWRI